MIIFFYQSVIAVRLVNFARAISFRVELMQLNVIVTLLSCYLEKPLWRTLNKQIEEERREKKVIPKKRERIKSRIKDEIEAKNKMSEIGVEYQIWNWKQDEISKMN